jgi:hypothetical protein
MSVRRYLGDFKGYLSTYPGFKILHGNDTDVTWVTIVKYSPNSFVVTQVFDNEYSMKLEPKVFIWTAVDLEHEFKLQHGSPMQYMSQEDYEWLKN